MSSKPARPVMPTDLDANPLTKQGNSPDTWSGETAGQPFDFDRFRLLYPKRWQAFLRAHFQSHLHVALMLEVDEKTARLWWEGSRAPRAHMLAVVIATYPGARAYLLPQAA